MLDLDKQLAAEQELETRPSSAETPLLALAQSCQSVLADHGFWLERYGSSLGCTWVRFRRIVREDASGVCSQVYLLAHDAEGQAFLVDDYLVQDRGQTQEELRHESWAYADEQDMHEAMRTVLGTLRAWSREPVHKDV